MADFIEPGPVSDTAGIREAVCIHTRKIFDSCRDKDCVEDLRLYPTVSSQAVIDRAISLKAGQAELLYAYIDVEPVGFNRGYFTVDVRYFYRVTADAFVGAARPVAISGLAVFDKRAILFGSEGSAKVFSSNSRVDDLDEQNLMSTNLPIAVVKATAPKQAGNPPAMLHRYLCFRSYFTPSRKNSKSYFAKVCKKAFPFSEQNRGTLSFYVDFRGNRPCCHLSNSKRNSSSESTILA